MHFCKGIMCCQVISKKCDVLMSKAGNTYTNIKVKVNFEEGKVKRDNPARAYTYELIAYEGVARLLASYGDNIKGATMVFEYALRPFSFKIDQNADKYVNGVSVIIQSVLSATCPFANIIRSETLEEREKREYDETLVVEDPNTGEIVTDDDLPF